MKLVLLGVVLVTAACGDNDHDDNNVTPDAAVPTMVQAFVRTDLVTDARDAYLINAWGITPGPQGFWIAANGTGKVAIYDGQGVAATGAHTSGTISLGAGITGVARNPSTTELVIMANGKSAPADFLFASEDGTLIGFSDAVDTVHGVSVVSVPDAIYKGVAIAMVRGLPRVYLADFHHGTVEAYDERFKHVSCPFADPNLPAGFAPFNIAVINSIVYVLYAQQDAMGEDDVKGPGLGMIDAYDVDGNLLSRFATGGPLNAPWGMTLAPASFGKFGGALLVGNFGDGHITAYSATGTVLGQLDDGQGTAIAIDGLWGLTFGDDQDAGRSDTLYFAAGPGDEAHGLYGRVAATTVTIP